VKDSMKMFHKVECALFKSSSLSTLDNILASSVPTAIRFLFEALEASTTVGRIRGLIEETESVSIFDFDFSDEQDENLDWHRLRILKSFLQSNVLMSAENYKSSITTVVEEICAMSMLPVEDQKTASEFVLRLVLIFKRNNWGMFDKDGKQSRSQSVGLFGSMINHSCAANTSVTSFGAKHVHFVNKPIKKGEQLFIRYR
jgi:SET domain